MAEKEYIEREAAIEAIDEALKRVFVLPVGKSIMNRIPAADVRPVCHGRWVKARGSWCTPGGDPVWECSECGKGKHVYGIEHGTYGADVADGQWVSCPNCGADMRGVDNG